MSKGYPDIIAHRGIRSEFPENTLLAIEQALKLPQLKGVEFDVELADTPVVLHQETVVPDAEFKKIQLAPRDYISRNWVAQYSASEITGLDAGSWFATEYSGLRVPHFREIMAANWNNKVAYIELKDPTFWGKQDLTLPFRIVGSILPELQSFSGSANVISFNPEVLKELRIHAVQIPCTLALWTEWVGRIEQALDIAVGIGAEVVSIADSMILNEPDWITIAQARGLKVHAYPISPARNEPEFKNWTAESQRPKWERLAALNIDGLISDFPRQTLEFFGQ